ncbi:threonine ammonia-lyase [Thermomonospora cellulosilytica]|uniref:threonine ammonia-lyase n=1 Tax=Thermomonospora cellulosilytica TaxID=1411118 RepID=A0A7W3MT51_9ACTN|nr:threonine/serine dehydratase [Thermomonospora cellulosilytica]MBA9001420.1 threonine dehydratase [Thermomonospora cellulosilytica]
MSGVTRHDEATAATPPARGRHRGAPGPELVTLADIEDAAARLAGVCVRTPLVPLTPNAPGLQIKAESLQPIGAFKLRGAYNAIARLPEERRARGVVTHSSGNHAQAVAYTAGRLGIPAVLVVPHTAPAVKVEACRRLGAEIVYVEPSMEARTETAERLAASHGFTLVPPFDDPGVIAGQGTVGLEIVRQAPDVEAVLVPVGGGGLISGVAAAVKQLLPQTRVIGVEPELAADVRDSLRAGKRVGWTAEQTGRTIADALRVSRVGSLTFAHIKEYVDDIVTVAEDEIRAAMRHLALHARLIAEPAGAVATAAYLFHRDELPAAARQVAVLSGGNVDPALLSQVLA